MLHFKTNCRMKPYFQNMDEHVGSKWLFHGNRDRKDN